MVAKWRMSQKVGAWFVLGLVGARASLGLFPEKIYTFSMRTSCFLFYLWTNILLWWCCRIRATQLPWIQQPVDQLYSFRTPLPSPVVPGEILRHWFGTGHTKRIQKDGVEMVQLTSLEAPSFGTMYHVAPLTTTNFNASFFYWIGTKEFQPRVDHFAFWYTKHPPTYGPAYGNEVGFEGLGIVIQLFDPATQGPIVFPVTHEPRTTAVSNNHHNKNEWQTQVLSSGCRLGSLTGKIYVAYQQTKVTVYQLPIQKQNVKPKPMLCFQAEIPQAAQLSFGYLGFTAKSEEYATEHNIVQFAVATEKTTESTAAKKMQQKTLESSPTKHVDSAFSGRPPSTADERSDKSSEYRQYPEKEAGVNASLLGQESRRDGNVQKSRESADMYAEMEHWKTVWDDTNEKQIELLAKLSQLLVEWQSTKRLTFITMVFAIALLVIVQFYAFVLYVYYRKLAKRLRYTKII